MSTSPSAVFVPSLPQSPAHSVRVLQSSVEFLRFAIAALIIPEIPPLLWYWQTNVAMQWRGCINVEYLLLLCISLLYPSRLMIAVLSAELTVALLDPIAHLYYFSPQVALFSTKYLLLFPFHRIAEDGCLVAGYVVGCAMLLSLTVGTHRHPHAKQLAAVALVIALLPLLADYSFGRFSNARFGPQRKDVDVRVMHVARAPVESLARAAYAGLFYPVHGVSKPVASALGIALKQVSAEGGQPDVVLVLTESWGLANDSRLNEIQLRPYSSPAIENSYQVKTGSVPFIGATTSGETRELCGDSIGHTSIDRPASFFATCWPARLNSAGYRTLATHGFTSLMFNRGQWYQRFGFQQTAFLPELQSDGASVCDGAFPGACDADVARWVGDRLAAPRDQSPMFVHWVTLNSHLPISSLADGTVIGDCVTLGIAHERSLCSWFRHVQIVHESVAQLAVRRGLRPTVFVIVGDHAPPFLRAGIRSRFSQTEVPYVILFPRSLKSGQTDAVRSDIRAGKVQ